MDLSEFDPSLVYLACPRQARGTCSKSLYEMEKCQESNKGMCSGNEGGNHEDPRPSWDAGLSMSWSSWAAFADPTVCQGHSVCYSEAVSFLC